MAGRDEEAIAVARLVIGRILAAAALEDPPGWHDGQTLVLVAQDTPEWCNVHAVQDALDDMENDGDVVADRDAPFHTAGRYRLRGTVA